MDTSRPSTTGETYSETSAAAREEGLDPEVAAELQAKADTLFKGETLRAILLNAYGWWTVATIALWAGDRDGDRRTVARDHRDPRVPARREGRREGAGHNAEHRTNSPEYADATR